MNITTQPEPRPQLTFDDIRQEDAYGNEFWYARALSKVLDYADYRNFVTVIEKVKVALKVSKYNVADHIVELTEMIDLGKGGQRAMPSFGLSRHACYLIVQNADSSKPVIAHGQVYFAVQARRQELIDNSATQEVLKEEEQRLFLRNKVREQNKSLGEIAANTGVRTPLDFAVFQNHGYKGLYGGLDAKGIHTAKGLKPTQTILDHMGSTELAANLFRVTQTEEKLKRDPAPNKTKSNRTHFEVGQKIRQTIEELGGTSPESLPTPARSVMDLEKAQKKLLQLPISTKKAKKSR